MTTEPRWFKNPQNLWAVLTIGTMVIGFFFVRERRDWEQSARITSVEHRGESAILSVGTRMERMETFTGSLRDQVNFLERKIDRLETKVEDQEKQARKHYAPQGGQDGSY